MAARSSSAKTEPGAHGFHRHPRFRFAVRPADRPARARGAGLLRAVPLGRAAANRSWRSSPKASSSPAGRVPSMKPGAPYHPGLRPRSRACPSWASATACRRSPMALGGQVDPSAEREYGPAVIQPTLPGTMLDEISRSGCRTATASRACRKASSRWPAPATAPIAAMGDMRRKYFGVQFHPEVHHTPNGSELLQAFRGGYLRRQARLDARLDHRGRRRAHPRAGGRRARAGGGQRRRGFDRGGGAGAPGRRRPA